MRSSGSSRWSLQPRHRIKAYRRYCQAGRYKRSNPIISFHRHGAEAARGAHNSEVTRSKRVAGIVKLDAINAALFKPLPRRTFYRLTSTLLTSQPRWSESRMVIFFIIKRTMWDRYLQVAIVKLDAINAASQTRLRSYNFTGMAQRQRAGLITPRTLDRNGLPVSIHINNTCLYD